MKTSPAETAWIEKYAGHYECSELGTARIFRHKEAYRIDFESWSSDLGVEEQSSDHRQIVLISPPWKGDLQLLVSDETNALILDGGQTKYEFVRIA